MRKHSVWIAMFALLALLCGLPAMAADLTDTTTKAGGKGNGNGNGNGNGGGNGNGNGGGNGNGNGGGNGNGSGNCGTCAGVITAMTLRYNGTLTGAEVRVVQKERSANHVLFQGTVAPGGEITIEGANRNGNLSPVLHIFINGRMHVAIPTSCAGLTTAGLVRGDFEVMEATSSQGGKICNDDDDDDGEDECCDGQVDELTLRYNGTETAMVKVTQKVGSRQVTVFEGELDAGEELTIEGKNNRGTFGSQIRIFVDGDLATTIHTSCSEPIGPGLERGDFEVISGTSRNGGDLCPIEDGGGSGQPGTCEACEGQVNELTLRYIGTEEDATIRVLQQDGNNKNVEVFEGKVAPGATFTIEGENKKGTFGPAIRIFVNGELESRIHTSCSEPIGPGLVEGDFEVVEGFSREGGRLCEIQTN